MIGRLSGRIDHRGPDHVLLDVQGVGYVVTCSERTLAALPGVGEAASLYTELLVREDLLQLFGFLSLQEREWYRLLTSVQGVGAKAALAILGALGEEGTSRAIALGDWSAVKAAQGVGPKIAQRVVNELKEKAPQVMALGAGGPPPASASGALVEPIGAAAPPALAVQAAPGRAAAQAEALSALVNLGYGHGEAAAAIAGAAGEGAEETPALIRAALRALAPRG
ncbi:Holliday junction branch migration protein RuvA [Maritimibacter sp. 55A14]|uniref:Holliday junction branch migration protein RuvA n=1 Tax=Maritimibacter sp. 55A14 TaxID=2174844 RepID=UPI000D620A4C|nr:Holliday junction branch migration protein RuvA [Maritimibacter sp. 55A14]PWE29433.1 Holliday junction branch migration protein RuvA [Maritimibacter sp. 55A14]